MPMYNPYSDPPERTQAKTAPPAAKSVYSDDGVSLPNSMSSCEDGEGRDTRPLYSKKPNCQPNAPQPTGSQADNSSQRHSKRRSTSLSIDRLKTEEEHMAEVIPALWGSEHDNISRPLRTPKTTKTSPLHEEGREKDGSYYGAVGSRRPTWRTCPECEKRRQDHEMLFPFEVDVAGEKDGGLKCVCTTVTDELAW